MEQRVVESACHAPAALPAIENVPKPAVIGGIGEPNVQFRARRAAFDPELQSTPNEYAPTKRQPIVCDQAIDFVELFFVARQPRANDDLAAELQSSLSAVRASGAAQKREPDRPFFDCAEQREGFFRRAIEIEARAVRLQAAYKCVIRNGHKRYFARRTARILSKYYPQNCG